MMVLFDMDTTFLGMQLLCVMGLFTVTVYNFLNFKICIYIQDVHKTENIRLYIMQIFMTLYRYDFGMECLKVYRALNTYKISVGCIGLYKEDLSVASYNTPCMQNYAKYYMAFYNLYSILLYGSIVCLFQSFYYS